MGRIANANSTNVCPNDDACPTRANATVAPERVDRYMPARLNDSFQASDRDASRLQCSVERICRRSCKFAPTPSAPLLKGVPTPCWEVGRMPGLSRSKAMSTHLAGALLRRREAYPPRGERSSPAAAAAQSIERLLQVRGQLGDEGVLLARGGRSQT